MNLNILCILCNYRMENNEFKEGAMELLGSLLSAKECHIQMLRYQCYLRIIDLLLILCFYFIFIQLCFFSQFCCV